MTDREYVDLQQSVDRALRVVRTSDGCWRSDLTRPMTLDQCKAFIRARVKRKNWRD